jgi:hypothetical protein
MRWFRVRSRRFAAVAMLSLAFAGLSAAAPHEEDCHEGCPAIAVEHDASAHRIASPDATDEHAIHCLACHWARSFRPRTESRVSIARAPEVGLNLHLEYVPAAVSAPIAQPPLRSPPPSPPLA